MLIYTLPQTLIAIRQLKGPHTGKNQAEIIIQVIEEFKLGKHIRYFVIDNATNNDPAINIVLKHFFPGMPLKRQNAQRLQCLGHMINLVAKVFLFSTEFDTFERDVELIKEKSELLQELKL